MKTETASKIITFLEEKGEISAKNIREHLGISKQAVARQLAKLLRQGKISKKGQPPVVFYLINKTPKEKLREKYPSSKIIDANFLVITPKGERLEGMQGFSFWCQKQKLNVEKTIKEYEITFKKYERYKKRGLIDGTYKFKATFNQVFVNKIYYLDFYSIERFGKTKLGNLLLYAKQSQNQNLILELASLIKTRVQFLIGKHDIDAVAFIPPTVKRQVQFMFELENNLSLKLPEIKIQKVRTNMLVPQKTLSRLEDRIENARETIVVTEKRQFKNVLLIDDAVGSGATINETSRKIKMQKIATGKIIGLSIVGSFKGFEVISEI